MFYRIIGRFHNTESAQSAARRINEKIPEVYQIRLRYNAEYLENGVTSNVVYSQNSNVLFEYGGENLLAWQEGFLGMPEPQMTDECHLSVIILEKYKEDVQHIFYNEGGYDVEITHTS